jgi:hypothetical protein
MPLRWQQRVAVLAAVAAAAGGCAPTAVAGVRVELHFESLCKQCQIHVGAIDDMVLHGGNEASVADAGVLSNLELSIDYYGTQDCEAVANATHTEHGPDMCVADRYHLCAQQLAGGAGTGAAATWWPFTHCMFMNVDQLKCGVNGHCADRAAFNATLRAAIPLCALVAGMSADAITACAESSAAVELADASYARTAKTLADGFAPACVCACVADSRTRIMFRHHHKTSTQSLLARE